jgi:hypothetical protein
MKLNINIIILLLTFCFSAAINAQTNSLEVSEEKERKFQPFMYHLYGGPEGVAEFKRDNRYEYLRRLWYYAESFYIRKDVNKDGTFSLMDSDIDISRFEQFRKESEEAIYSIEGCKDVIVLLPANKLIYRPK